MSYTKEVTLWCDHPVTVVAPACEEFIELNSFDTRSGNLKVARKTARGCGWRSKNGKDYCPAHAKLHLRRL